MPQGHLTMIMKFQNDLSYSVTSTELILASWNHDVSEQGMQRPKNF